jgi:hypothetical protein
MRLLSDFDGVWTHPREESLAQGRILDRCLVDWLGEARADAARALLARVRGEVRAEPLRYGWAPGGTRISAFADEDPFAEHSAVLHWLHLHQGGEPLARAMVEAVLAHGHADLGAFGGWTHKQGVVEVETARGPAILPAAAAAGRALIAAGHEIVLVSNSTTEKLERWFGHAAVPFTVHPERRSAAMRLRGDARKFVLDRDGAEVLPFGDLAIDVRRPFYDAILSEEAPDAVVGDVFSLDLALPLARRRRDPAWRGVRLFWLARDYAAPAVRRMLETAAVGEVEVVEDGLEGVVARLLRG